MTDFIIKKQGKGNFKVYVIEDYAIAGEFKTTDSTLIDDIQDWKEGQSYFMNFDTRADLMFHVRNLAGINSIAGVDFFKDINNLLNL